MPTFKEKNFKNFGERISELENDLISKVREELKRINRNVSVSEDNLQLGSYPDNGFYENIDFFTPEADIVFKCESTEDISGWLTNGGGMSELLALINDLSDL